MSEDKLVFDETEKAILVAGYGNMFVALKEKDYERCEGIIQSVLNLVGESRYNQVEEIVEKLISKAVKEHRNKKNEGGA